MLTECQPLISICIPTYNRAEYLKKCIQSVLQYDGDDVEIVVCNNASTDGTDEVVGRYIKDSRIRFYRNEENIGPIRNFYRLIDLAKGEYLLFVTDDDILLPGAIDRLKKFLNDHDVSFVKADLLVYNEKSKTAYNYSYFKNDIIFDEGDFDNLFKVWTAAHVFTGCCFKKNSVPTAVLQSFKLNWYPTMLIVGLIKGKFGYISEPLGIHIWENELFWDKDGVKSEDLNRSIIDGLKESLVFTNYSSKIQGLCFRYASQLLQQNNFIHNRIDNELIQLLNLEDKKKFLQTKRPPLFFLLMKKSRQVIKSIIYKMMKHS